ncbi:hypothetical protein D8B26_003079 [Coccidioides posadasii str. Silveira]|uniref:Phosphoglycerate mutase family domain-containing protein n=2 Tax=Coccidioides posadasii TaxID=199306 RepID=E9CZC0_COCPS|nr:phosphoglycerate mutase family domain-containing protein [Coccidioides posadasii str. Silveira]QVM08387.1 hypothetical protein D8B26_003079 [Coccidioides posadasii str. Silveira]
MGKPRLIILIRHAQSEGNKNREIHQSVPDHRVKLTPEGHRQALEAGRRLRAMLRPDDTLHFFTSPYRRTRETTEGILTSLTSDDPSPSPFPRNTIKVYEEPRLREQDFGNFQPCSAAMEKMWQERADYGHFFYRIPNGESAADAYDRVSGFNESLWRLFGEDDFASVCVLVTHGLMTRIFLMKWYHFSVEYFEDLRNINHCEFVVMEKNQDNGKYILQNQLRTWSELKLQRDLDKQKAKAAREAAFGTDIASTSPVMLTSVVPIRRKWGGCPDGCNHGSKSYRRKSPSLQKQNSQPAPEEATANNDGENEQQEALIPHPEHIDFTSRPVNPKPYLDHTHQTESEITRGLAILQLGGGRDAGGSRSGATSRASFASNRPDDEDLKNLYANGPINPGGIDDQEDQNGQTPRPPNMLNFAGSQHQLRTTLRDSRPHAMANSLGDTDDNGLASRRSSSSLCSNDEDGAAEKDPPPPSTNGEKAISDELQDEEEAVDMIKEREQGVQASVY